MQTLQQALGSESIVSKFRNRSGQTCAWLIRTLYVQKALIRDILLEGFCTLALKFECLAVCALLLIRTTVYFNR